MDRRRSAVLMRKLRPILRIPAGDVDQLDPDALLTEEGDELTTEDGYVLITEGY